jgi:hypothetical protein
MKYIILFAFLALSTSLFSQTKQNLIVNHTTNIQFDTLLNPDIYIVEVTAKSYFYYQKKFMKHEYNWVSLQLAEDTLKQQIFQFKGDSSLNKINESQTSQYSSSHNVVYQFEISTKDSIWILQQLIGEWKGLFKLKIRPKIYNSSTFKLQNQLKAKYLNFEDPGLDAFLATNKLTKDAVINRNVQVILQNNQNFNYNYNATEMKIDIQSELTRSHLNVYIYYSVDTGHNLTK